MLPKLNYYACYEVIIKQKCNFYYRKCYILVIFSIIMWVSHDFDYILLPRSRIRIIDTDQNPGGQDERIHITYFWLLKILRLIVASVLGFS